MQTLRHRNPLEIRTLLLKPFPTFKPSLQMPSTTPSQTKPKPSSLAKVARIPPSRPISSGASGN